MIAIILLSGLIYWIYRDHKIDKEIEKYIKDEEEFTKWR